MLYKYILFYQNFLHGLQKSNFPVAFHIFLEQTKQLIFDKDIDCKLHIYNMVHYWITAQQVRPLNRHSFFFSMLEVAICLVQMNTFL